MAKKPRMGRSRGRPMRSETGAAVVAMDARD
jgi:hypothetical protein